MINRNSLFTFGPSQHNMMLVLLFSFLLVIARAQKFTNTLSVMNTNPSGTMVFNIKINGVDYFDTPQIVTTIGSYKHYPFQRTLTDVVEVIFEKRANYPGFYNIHDESNFQVFSSKTHNFYIVNQCNLNGGCMFSVDTVGLGGTFPAGSTASILVNGVEMIAYYDGSGSSAPFSIQKDDIINIKIAGDSTARFGMNFNTLYLDGTLLASSTWYNDNLATQMITRDFFFTAPTEGITIYPSTNLPVKLVSYPGTFDANVLLYYLSGGYPALVIDHDIPTNTPTAQNFLMPADFSGLPTRNLQLMASYDFSRSLNYINLKAMDTIPTSIKFDLPVSGKSFYAASSIPVKLTSAPEAGIFMVHLKCGTLETISKTIVSNTLRPESFPVPYDHYGSCVFSITYPIASENTPVVIVLPPRTAFVKPPNNVVNGKNFVVKIETVGDPDPAVKTMDLEMVCAGKGQVALWTDVALNEFATLLLDNPSLNGGPLKCELKTLPLAHYQPISSNTLAYIQMKKSQIAEFKQMNNFAPGLHWDNINIQQA